MATPKQHVNLRMILLICKKNITFEVMKILFVGDASNLHNCLAQQLRAMGHTAVVASNGSRWMDTRRDIDLTRHSGRWGAVRYVASICSHLRLMRGFDIVQLCNPIFLELKPRRIRPVFNYLRSHNRHVVVSALGTTTPYFDACLDGHTFRYSDYRVGNQPSPYVDSSEYVAQHQDNWRSALMHRWDHYVFSRSDGAIACLYEYYAALKPVLGDRLAYAGIPIDVDHIEPHFINETPQRVRFFIGIQRDRNVVKGTDRLLAALKKLALDYPDRVAMEVVESLPYAEYVRRMSRSHVILDQLYSYTPATNALLAMAQGLVAVSGAEPEYYDLIGEKENHPIINVTPYSDEDIYRQLEWVVLHRDQLPRLSHQSRAFVEKHNAAALVARRHLTFWQRLSNHK